MFILKQVEELRDSIDNKLRLMESQIANHISQDKMIDFVECEVCGCLLNREKAIKGVGEIRQRWENVWSREKKDFIYYPFYCKVHQPRVKK